MAQSLLEAEEYSRDNELFEENFLKPMVDALSNREKSLWVFIPDHLWNKHSILEASDSNHLAPDLNHLRDLPFWATFLLFPIFFQFYLWENLFKKE